MKKLLVGITAGCIAVCSTMNVFASTFSDVPGKSYAWAEPYIEEMVQKELIKGYEDGTFLPGKVVSRIEAISLFARAMGSRDEINADAVEAALTEYKKEIASYELNFGQEDVAYMLYRGALTPEEAASYLKGAEKNVGMKRFEAATIITKIVGGDAEAKRNVLFDLEYKDVSEIPADAKKYVYYVTEKEIMSGMDNGSFSPNTEVLRAQIAVMLKNTLDKIGVSVFPATVTSIDTDDMTLMIELEDGSEDALTYTEDTLFFADGEKVADTDLSGMFNVTITKTENSILYIDVFESEETETVTGIFKSSKYANGQVTLNVADADTKEITAYTCVKNISDVTKGDKKITVSDIKSDDYISLTLVGGKVVSISSMDKNSTIKSAKVVRINIDSAEPTMTISHKDSAYDGLTLKISPNATVVKDGSADKMTSVFVGDDVSLTLEYGLISQVLATGLTSSVEGVIKAVTISANPTIDVLVNDEIRTYDVAKSVAITINGEEGDLYGFRVGDRVSVSLSSGTVTKIATIKSQAVAGQLTGTVTAVNASFGFIKVLLADGNGEETIYCTDTKTTFITSMGASKRFKDIAVDSVVTAYGTTSNGAFEAKSVIIMSEK